MSNGTTNGIAPNAKRLLFAGFAAILAPNNRTHYLNMLHASWPAGLVIGGAAGAFLGEHLHWGWKAQLALFLVPTAGYGLMFFGQKFPKSEASEKGLSLGEMFKDV